MSIHLGLPVHPFTGVRALWVSPSGRAFYPIAGADSSGDAEPGRIEQLETELAALRTEIDTLDSVEPVDEPAEGAPEAERSAFTAYTGQMERFATALDEFDARNEEHTRLVERRTRVERVRSASFASAGNRERGAGGAGGSRQRQDPFADLDRMRAGLVPLDEIRGRALDVVEHSERMEDDAKEHVTRLLEGKGYGSRHIVGKKTAAAVAQHVLETGSEDYHDHFERYMEDPQGYAARAALSLTSANGGYLVPFTLDPTIILTNAGSANPFRKISNVKTTGTNTWNGVTSAGVNAGWLAEGTEDTDHSPTVGNLQITPQKASAWVFGSYEILEDSDFASQFPTLLADAKDRLEEAAFATGSGSGQPFGVVPRATTVNSIGTGAFAIGDVYAVQQALPARFRGPMARNAWVANLAIINKARQFDTAGGSSYWTNLGLSAPEQVLGADLYESTSMVGTITTGSKNLLIGDFNQYFIVDRIGMSVLYEPMVKGTANARPTGQAGWFAFWRVGADVSTTNAFRVLVEI